VKLLWQSNPESNRLLWALGIHSSGIIAYQLVLMHLISIMQWYHFAYMIISIAMLGFGASGTILALFKGFLIRNSSWIIPTLTTLTGLLMIVVFHLTRHPSLQFDLYLLFVDTSQFKTLAITFLLFFLPFFTGAMVIGIVFIQNASKIGKYYFSNLLGSGIGGGIAVLALSYLHPLTILPLISVIHILAGLMLLNRQYITGQLIATFASLGAAVIFFVSPGTIPVSQYKDISKVLNLPDARIVHAIPDVHGLIEVVESPVLRYAPALSLTYTGSIPVKKKVFLNGSFYGAIPEFKTDEPNIHDFTTEALPFVMRHRTNVLVLNATTGNSIAHSIRNGASSVTGVVEVMGVKALMNNELLKSSGGLFHHENVNILFQDSRQYIMQDNTRLYDAIILPRQENFGGSLGMHALDEDYIMTIEAFDRMWDMLSPDGVIVVTSWLDHPPRTILKIAATIGETLKANGIERPHDHIAAIRSWGTITFAIKKNPITPDESYAIRQFSQKKLFDPLLLPDITEYERVHFNMLESNDVIRHIDELTGNKPTSLLDNYQFYIHPASDDKPYFQRFLRLSNMPEKLFEEGLENIPFIELGYLIVWITLIQSAVLALILIILPLLRLKGKSTRKTGTLLYFGSLGLGYMFVEIILIQRFILYFGHPVYSIAAVLSTMLIASGAGSLVSGRYSNALKVSGMSTIIVALILVVYAFFLTPVLTGTIQLSLIFKLPIALILIAIPAFFMGMPFPSGIRLLHGSESNNIPWAWGINGCLSVMATSLATLIAVEKGFSLVLMLSSLLYLAAFIVFYGRKKFLPTD